MKVTDYWQVHQELTGKSSDIVRTLVLSGVAIVWVFSKSLGDGVELPRLTLFALLFFCGGVICDLLQYVWSGHVYGAIARRAEKAGRKQEEDIGLHSVWLNTPTYLFYWSKIGLTVLGYLTLGVFLIGRLHVS
jgi:hypothetical protein